MKFHNPYQFINIRPSKPKISYTINNKKEKEKEIESEFVRHDYWAEEGLSGTITCQLKTQSPLVIGAKQTKGTNNSPGIVEPYKHPDGSIALPANSLRGMIGSLAENISQSSLRVLASKKESTYSARKDHRQALKTVGLLLKEGDKFYLHPLKDDKNKPSKAWMLSRSDVTKFDGKTYHHNDPDKQIFYYAEKDVRSPFITHAKNLSTEKSNNKQKGVLYIRGDFFKDKTHESFIPWDGKVPKQKYEVTSEVAQLQTTLQKYCGDSPEDSLPIGYFTDKKPIVRHGDLIYFKKHTDNSIELSYSQVWRESIAGDLYQSIEKQSDKNALPWNQNREALTPAEALFGVVETDFREEDSARNLASRLRFTDAKPNQSVTLSDRSQVILKILDSPKPPSPSMYFQSDENKPIKKQDLNLNVHKPNGRKHYLPHSVENKLHNERDDWVSGFEEDETKNNYPTDSNNQKNWKQYLKVTPIPLNTTFNFDIHFENLSKEELGLILTTLEPAESTEKFIHKLGLGKPLGLGEVTLRTKSIIYTSKAENYSVEGLSNPPQLKELENTKIKAFKTQAMEKKYVDESTLKELRILYNPDNIKHPVCYPFISSSPHKQQAGEEGEGFKWFAENEKRHEHYLKPIKENEIIHPLSSFDKDD